MLETPRRVVVTGAAGVLGAAVARAFLATGASLALIDRVAPPQDMLSGGTGARFFLEGIDLTDAAQAEHAMGEAASSMGGIDVLVNVAGGFRWETLADGSLDTWDFLYSINLKTAVCACKAALPHLAAGRGRIVNVGAAAAVRAALGMGAYTASKAGVAKLTEALAEELKDRAINVNAVLPTIIDTPANRAEMPTADFSRWVDPRALADVVVFLASHEARAITGASILVSGRV